MDTFYQILIAVGILILIIHHLFRRVKPNKNKAKGLYQSILHDGCPQCKASFSIVHSIDMPVYHYMLIIECDDCYEQYKIDHTNHKAWSLDIGT